MLFYLTGTPKHEQHFRKEGEIRTTLQELLLYCIFLINLCICKYTCRLKTLFELRSYTEMRNKTWTL